MRRGVRITISSGTFVPMKANIFKRHTQFLDLDEGCRAAARRPAL